MAEDVEKFDGPAPAHSPSLHDLDERWTIPWALLEAPPPGGGAALTWHGREGAFSHAGYSIARPMLYSSDGMPAEQEASCIDTTLPVGDPDGDGVPRLPHWATYAGLTPGQRANYLQWLASGRRSPLRDINYAFLYFYGLERHALIDRGDPEDILRVLMGLLKHYDGNASFFSSASRLAAFLFATKGIEKLKPAWFDRLFVKRAVPLHPDSISVALTWLFERGKPLPATLAFEIARQDLRCPHGAAYRSDITAFEAAFTKAYTDRFGEGMMLQRAEQEQTWKYRPVNPSLQSWTCFGKLWSVTSADVAAEQAQFAPLVEIWRGCLPSGETAGSAWVTLIDKHINSEGRVQVPVRRLAGIAGVAVAEGDSATLESSEEMMRSAALAGFELLPNPGILLRPLKWKERVALVRRPEPPHPEGESYYRAGALLLALGAAMGEVDGVVDQVEVLHVSEIVNSLYHFNDYDKHRLGVLRKRLLRFPPRLASLTRRVRAVLSVEELVEVARFLAGVAGANFHVDEDELRALRRACRTFGIGRPVLEGLLSTLLGPPGPDGRHSVHEETLARYMCETKDFAIRLGVAMQEIEIAPAGAGERGVWYVRRSNDATVEAPALKSDPYRDALYALLLRPDWTEADLIVIGEQHGMFVPGAVRGSDDWVAEVGGGLGDRLVVGDLE